jgi:hypothetical protein
MKLVHQCTTCGRPFNFDDSSWASWQPCDCKEWISTGNDRFLKGDLLHAQLRSAFYNFGFQMPRDYVVKAFDKRLKIMQTQSERWSDHVAHLEGGGSDSLSLHSFLIEMGDWRELTGTYLVDGVPLLDSIGLMFSSFEEFLSYSNCPHDELVSVASKWSRYFAEYDISGKSVFGSD